MVVWHSPCESRASSAHLFVTKVTTKTPHSIKDGGFVISDYANISSNTALSWQTLSFQFAGNGLSRNIRIQLEGGTAVLGRGAMLDGIHVIETLLPQGDTVYGFVNQAIELPKLNGALTDTDGSELLTMSIQGIPCGSVISVGSHTFTASSDNATLSLTG